MGKARHDISFFGEFADKALEQEFFIYDMKRHAKIVGPVVLMFGLLYMIFIIPDYLTIKDPRSFIIILIIRVVFLVFSVMIFIFVNEITNYANLSYVITAYEILAIIGFFAIIYQYESFSYMLFLSVISMTLAIYIIPNRLIYLHIITLLLSLPFFMHYIKYIEGIKPNVYWQLLAYYLIALSYCNIEYYITNYYKRKQFVESRELFRISITDSLTGIYNRAKFSEELVYWADYSSRYENPLSLVMIDIDDLKKINDSYGHIMGDSVIKSIALTIKNTIRNTDIFARLSGDEFAIILPNTDISQSIEMMERVRIYVSENKYENVENVTCSLGLVELKENEKPDSLLKRADKLLYGAKSSGKNIVISETSEIGKQIEQASLYNESMFLRK